MTLSQASAQTPALSQLLMATAQALQSVRAGTSATAVIAGVPAPLRAGVQALLFYVLRQWGMAQALRQRLVQRPPAAAVDALLCSALALLWDAQAAPYETFTLVDQAVQACKRQRATRHQAGFVNACLRRFVREREALVADALREPVARWNHPAWWIERLRADHPAHWEQILQTSQQAAPLTLRLSESKVTASQYIKALKAIDLEAIQVGESTLLLPQSVPVARLPGFAQGWVSVQDAGAQRAAPLLLQGLDERQPLQILDACAAPGGKTAHLLEWAALRGAPWKVTALEVDAARAARISENLQRLQLDDPARVQVRVVDAGQPGQWWAQANAGQLWDAILLDAPCSASGIVRRHPDVRWLRRASDIAQLAAQQLRLLTALWPLLRPGGRLLYCTCSVFRAEGQEPIEAFVARHTDALVLPAPGHLLPGVMPQQGAVPDNAAGEHDGFFYALLRKAAP